MKVNINMTQVVFTNGISLQLSC